MTLTATKYKHQRVYCDISRLSAEILAELFTKEGWKVEVEE